MVKLTKRKTSPVLGRTPCHTQVKLFCSAARNLKSHARLLSSDHHGHQIWRKEGSGHWCGKGQGHFENNCQSKLLLVLQRRLNWQRLACLCDRYWSLRGQSSGGVWSRDVCPEQNPGRSRLSQTGGKEFWAAAGARAVFKELFILLALVSIARFPKLLRIARTHLWTSQSVCLPTIPVYVWLLL